MRETRPSETLLGRRLSAFERHLEPARSGDREAVHRARVATRRLRAVLPLVTSGSRRRKLERAVRRLTRILGPLRELDVAIAMLSELHGAGNMPDTAQAPLMESLLAERRVVLAAVGKRLDRFDLQKLRSKAVAAVRRGKAPETRQDREAYLQAARRRSARRAERLRDVVERASGMYLPDRLHEIRIAAKKLRYTLEIVRDMKAPAAASKPAGSRTQLAGQIAMLKRTQDLLGRVHDLEVLIARTRAVQSAPRAPDLKVSGDLDAFVRRLETECRRLHGQYVASRPHLLDLCGRVSAWSARTAGGASAA